MTIDTVNNKGHHVNICFPPHMRTDVEIAHYTKYLDSLGANEHECIHKKVDADHIRQASQIPDTAQIGSSKSKRWLAITKLGKSVYMNVLLRMGSDSHLTTNFDFFFILLTSVLPN